MVYLICFLLVLFTELDHTAIAFTGDKRELSAKTVDIRDFLNRVSLDNRLSLIVASNVRGHIEYQPGATIEETLNNSLKGKGLRWRLIDGCLYVGSEENLSAFVDNLYNHAQISLRATHGGRVNADFKTVDPFQLAKILSRFSSIQIRIEPNLDGNMILRAVMIPWERVLLAMVYLNGFRMIQSEFSIFIFE